MAKKVFLIIKKVFLRIIKVIFGIDSNIITKKRASLMNKSGSLIYVTN